MLTRKKLAIDIFFSFLSPVIQNVSNLIIMFLITKKLGELQFGLFIQFTITLNLVSIVVCLNMGHGIGRFAVGQLANDVLSKIFTSIIFSVFITTTLTFFVAYIFSDKITIFLFDNLSNKYILYYLFIAILFRGFNYQNRAVLRAQRYVKIISVIDIFIFIILTIAIFVSSLFTQNISYYILFSALSEVVFALLFFIVLHTKNIRFSKIDFKVISFYLKYGLTLFFATISYWIVNSSDRYIIKHFFDVSMVGVYSIGYTITNVILLIWNAFVSILYNDLSFLYDSKQIEELELRFNKILKYNVAVTIAMISGLFIVSKPLLILFTKFSKENITLADNTLKIVAVATLFYALFLYFSNILNILKKVNLLSLFWLIMGGINIALNFILIPRIGVVGAAYATLISFFAGSLIIIFYSIKYFKIVFKIDWIVKIIIANLIMISSIYFIKLNSLLSILFVAVLGFIVFSISLYFINFFDENEKILIKKIIKKIIKKQG